MRTVNHKKRAEKKAAIRTATAKIFAQKGFHQAGMQELCQAANSSPGAMYSYYPSKSDIIAAVVKDHFRDLYDFITDLEESSDPFSLLVMRFKNTPSAAHLSLHTEIYSEAVRNKDVAEIVKEAENALQNALIAVFEGRGYKIEQAESAARYVILLMQGIEQQRALWGAGFDEDAMCRHIEHTLNNLQHESGLWKRATSALFAKG